MIHEAIYKDKVAVRYYKIVAPKRKYSNEQARKQFHQDLNIDKKILRGILKVIFKEQFALLKKK